VRDKAESRKLYSEVMGIPVKEESGEYLHTEALKGAKMFAMWPLSQVAQFCFGKDSWPTSVAASSLANSSPSTSPFAGICDYRADPCLQVFSLGVNAL
jgi:hypothetical protein